VNRAPDGQVPVYLPKTVGVSAASAVALAAVTSAKSDVGALTPIVAVAVVKV